jgi:hypothetical protein
MDDLGAGSGPSAAARWGWCSAAAREAHLGPADGQPGRREWVRVL